MTAGCSILFSTVTFGRSNRRRGNNHSEPQQRALHAKSSSVFFAKQQRSHRDGSRYEWAAPIGQLNTDSRNGRIVALGYNGPQLQTVVGTRSGVSEEAEFDNPLPRIGDPHVLSK